MADGGVDQSDMKIKDDTSRSRLFNATTENKYNKFQTNIDKSDMSFNRILEGRPSV